MPCSRRWPCTTSTPSNWRMRCRDRAAVCQSEAGQRRLAALAALEKRDSHSKNGPSYDARSYLYRLTGVDLVAISGLNESTVQTIISEVGTDLRPFPARSTSAPGWVWRPITTSRAANVCAVAPSRRTTAPGKPFAWRPNRCQKPRERLRGLLSPHEGPARRQASYCGHRPQDRPAFYHMLKHRTPFHDLGGEEYERRAHEREIKNLRSAPPNWVSRVSRRHQQPLRSPGVSKQTRNARGGEPCAACAARNLMRRV